MELGPRRHQGRTRVATGVLLASTILGLAAFVLGTSSRAVERRPDALLLFTGSVHGFLEECGCERFPLGGLDRRAGFLRLLRKEHRGTPKLLLDVGNFSDEASPGGKVKTRRLLEGMAKLGYVAAGVGTRELALGEELFDELTANRPFPFLSANLVRESSQEPWLAPSTVVLAGEVRLGVIALTAYSATLRMPLADGDAVVSIDPVVGLRRALEGLEGKADVVVLLAALPVEEARLLVRRVQGVDLVLGSSGDELLDSAITEGESRIIYGGKEGQYVGQVDIYLDEEGVARSFSERLVSLGEAIPSDESMEAFVIEGMFEAQEADREALEALRAEISGEPTAGPTYVGSGSCTACHPDIVVEWSRTRHRYAWESLRRGAAKLRESCVACHVTGYGEPTGYRDESTTPHLQEVGCESCHGPASEHVRRTGADYGAISIASCTGCHDAANDPTFSFSEDRRLVSHEAR